MFRTFDEIERHILSSGVKKRIALTGAHDSYSLEAVVHAKRKGLVTAALLGRVDEIASLLRSMDEPQDGYELIACETEEENARRAVAMVHEGKADMPMKGLLQTSAYMHAVLDKHMGLLPQGGLLSQSTLVEWTKEGRMFQITDCAINIAPDVQQKKKIVENAVRFAHRLGCECPKVAVVSAVEAARHKGVTDPAAGSADILVMPELCAGNIFTKSITFFAGLRSAGVLLGTTTPVIATSRTDTPENKYHGILMSLLNAL